MLEGSHPRRATLDLPTGQPRGGTRSRLVRGIAIAVAALAAGLPAADALAQAKPKDAQAEKALSEAMGDDYLQTKFTEAARKLRAAIDACGADACTPAVKVRLYVALGSVLAHGEKQLEDARDAFVEALSIDPAATPDPDLSSTEISFAFQQARAALGLDGAAASSGELQIEPPKEQRLHTPVPLFVEVRADLIERTKRVSVWYLAPGATEYRALLMKKLRDRAYGINVPCADLGREGTLKYYIAAVDDQGAIVATAGSRDKPLATQMMKSIASGPPHWPGFAPPETCAAEASEQAKQCLDDRQCNAGLVCVGGECTQRREEPAEPDVRRNWFAIQFSPDVSLFSGDNVCTAAGQESDHYVCLRGDGTRYDGTPTQDIADNVNVGFALATLRVAVAYDRLLLDNLTAGARAGFAIGGATEGGASFLPLHLEARAQYFFGRKPFESKGVRPFAMVAAGLAQVDTKVQVEVLEDAAACGADPNNAESPCTVPGRGGVVEQRRQFLDAYKQAGLGFASIGVGVGYAPVDALSLNLAVRASLTFPVTTVVLSPEVAVALGF